MSVPFKWMVKDGASTLYACGFPLDEQDMISKPTTRKKEKKRTENDDMKQPPNISDKEYIVFRFGEDGGIDMAEEKSLTTHWDLRMEDMHHNHKTLKELMMFEEHSRGSQFKVNEDGLIISDDECEERTSNIECSKELIESDENEDGDDIKVITAIEESTEHKALWESSSRSDSSSGSFAFPVIMNMEMKAGSPERMPKHKLGRILQFPCCRF